jgi:type I restriction enzyme S subunit
VDRGYVAALLRREQTVKAVMTANTGARMPRADMKVLLSLPVSLPPLDEQRSIVDILNRANGIRRLRREALAKSRQLIPVLFVEMFGDLTADVNKWPTISLKDVADIGSGATKGRHIVGTTIELPYLRVANVQDGALHLDVIKTMAIRPCELERYRLQPGDLVMTEGGDPDKLGRAALWTGLIDPCLHQNHIFRVRCDRTKVEPEFLRAQIGSNYGKRFFLRNAKQTTGIASINKTQLGNFPTKVPPLDRQRKFTIYITDMYSVITQQERMAAAADQLVASLMARFFDNR